MEGGVEAVHDFAQAFLHLDQRPVDGGGSVVRLLAMHIRIRGLQLGLGGHLVHSAFQLGELCFELALSA